MTIIGVLTVASFLIDAGFSSGDFRWRYDAPLVEARTVAEWDWVSVKDPSIVRYQRRWHLFCTVRGPQRSHAIVYLSFRQFDEANEASRHVLSCHPGYFCAPQVFYFAPQQKWYLICQAADDAWGQPPYRPAFTTTNDISDPNSWAKLRPMFDSKPENVDARLDFWVICDEVKAYLFFTSLDGRMWRAQTALPDFPKGWSEPEVCLTGDIFEASHTYRLAGQNKYLTLIEAQNGHGWRYYKAYTADHLVGQWEPLAAGRDDAFASMRNVTAWAQRWTDVISHGELLRVGYDEKLTVDPTNLRLVFQGVLDTDRQGKSYGEIPWSLGLLESADEK